MLEPKDVENPLAIENAVEEALGLAEIQALREELSASYDHVSRYYMPAADETFPPTSREPGEVRFKVAFEVADVLDLEIDDTRKIKQRLEEHLFRLYSNIGALRHPDKVGIQWGSQNYGRHLYAFEDVPPEKAREAQARFEENFPVRNLTSKELRAVWRKTYSD